MTVDCLPGLAVRESTSAIALDVADARKSYGDVSALVGVSLSLRRGEATTVVGQNGAGKTTLLSAVVGLVELDDGTIAIDGLDVRTQRRHALSRVAYAPQRTGVCPLLSVRENLQLFDRLSPRRGPARMDEVVESLQLGDLLDRKAGQLSVGQRRRVHVAMALVDPAPLLVLDEATAGVDIESRDLLLALVRTRVADGHAALLATHLFDDVERVGGTVAVLDAGAVVDAGTVAELTTRHAAASVTVTVDGHIPARPLAGELRRGAETVVLAGDDVAAAVATVRSEAPDARILAVRSVPATLEQAYRRLVGATP